ncbi:MAG: hypothetical protein VZS44_03615 [Bacilli bacterium]|nr:hypothetical protein [Bacilli bacterium]
MKSQPKRVNINDNYGALLRALVGKSDITPYVYDGIEEELDRFINLLNAEEKTIIHIAFGLDDEIIKSCHLVAKILSNDNHKYDASKINRKLGLALRRITLINSLGKEFKDYGTVEFSTYRFDKKKIIAELPHAIKWSKSFDKKNQIQKSERTETYEMVYEKLISSKDINPEEEPTVVRTFRK